MYVELYKLLRKKTTYLLILPLALPLFWGFALVLNIDTGIVEDGITYELISRGVGFLEFTYEMISLANIFYTFVIIIISALLMAKEIETNEINLYVVRVGARAKILWARFIALFTVQIIFYFLFILLTGIIYLLLADVETHGIAEIWDTDINRYLVAILATFVSNAILLTLTLLVGVQLKTFACFATVFILYVISLYFEQFATWLQLLFPEHFATYVIQNGLTEISSLLYFLLFLLYGGIFLVAGMILFKRKEL